MTETNAKKLYLHFLKTEQAQKANSILKAYPHFAEEKVEEKVKIKFKGKK